MTEETAPKTDKSIVSAKYRQKKKPDWMGKLIATHSTKTKDKTITEGEGDKAKQKVVQVPDGIDLNGLFALAEANGLDVSKFRAKIGNRGLEGQARMSVRNMLENTTKKRHGLYVPHGDSTKWTKADPEWLTARGAPEKPTYDKSGEKFAEAKPAKKESAKADAAAA